MDAQDNDVGYGWASRDTQFTFQTSNSAYHTFFTMGMEGGTPHVSTTRPLPRLHSDQLFGLAFDLFDDLLSTQHTMFGRPSRTGTGRTRQAHIEDDDDDDDDDDDEKGLAYGELPSHEIPRPQKRSSIPAGRPPLGGQRSYEDQPHEYTHSGRAERNPHTRPSSDQFGRAGADREFDSPKARHRNRRREWYRRANDATYGAGSDNALETKIDSLLKIAHHHEIEVTRISSLLRSSVLYSSIDPFNHQILLQDLEKHQRALRSTQHEITEARAQLEQRQRTWAGTAPPMGQSQWDRGNSFVNGFPRSHFGSFASAGVFSDLEEFEEFASPRNEYFSDNRRFSRFGFSPFGGFQSSFSPDFDNIFDRFSAFRAETSFRRQQSRPTFSSANSHYQSRHIPTSNFTYTSPVQSQGNPLSIQEAKTLFATYDESWTSLSPTDAKIPYPARKLSANELLNRESISPPQFCNSISTWSNESVMRANAQAFFLGAVGLKPQYSPNYGGGVIQMGFDKTEATAAQVQELISLLKKEKTRWHSDRLGRRNGGATGTNQVLQQDEKARAVFHAVIELMEKTK